MPTEHISDEEYGFRFIEGRGQPYAAHRVHENALERALDIRRFEIDLYWKRAAYFLTFIAASLAGFIAIQASQAAANKTDLSVLLCNIGIVFSFGWFCVNRGSKYWQENWEYHVDMLEDKIQGPLYKVVLSRRKPKDLKQHAINLLTGPSPISVSKVDHLISLFITAMWLALLIYPLPPFRHADPINFYYVSWSCLAVLVCFGFTTLAKTNSGGYWHHGTIRTATIRSETRKA